MQEITPHNLYQIVNPAALLGWIWLLVWLFLPTPLQRRTSFVGLVLPLSLALFYAGSMLVYFRGNLGDFDRLENVISLFTQPGLTLAGWAHYLSFDLFVGWCIVRDAASRRINRLLVVPCLLLTLLLGPVGLLLYSATWLAYRFRTSSVEDPA